MTSAFIPPSLSEFFSELSTSAYSLSLNSSMMELVHYIRQGLQWLRLEPNTP